MKLKLLTRLLCALLSVLMLVCMIPAITVSAEETAAAVTLDTSIDYTSVEYESAEARFDAMTPMYDNGSYSLRCDTILGIVAYRNNATGEILFTNPWNMTAEKNTAATVRNPLMSQITLSYVDSQNDDKDLNSYEDAALKGQITVKQIKNGLRVEYVIGERSARTLLPQMIERSAFEEKILTPILEGASSRDYSKFKSYYNDMFYASLIEAGKTEYAEAIAKEEQYAVAKEKYIDIYVLQYDISDKDKRELEAMILEYCPEYTYEEMDNDHAYVNYEEESVSPPVFKMALEYTLDAQGLVVTLPANGLRYDESSYRITDMTVLPYMGACNKDNEGYSFIPDGSGTLFALNESVIGYNYRIYGEDYSLSTISDAHNQTIRMPVYGQVETITVEGDGTTEATSVKRGYLAIIESGEALASLQVSHQSSMQYASIIPSFITRQSDTASKGSWNVYACRRYVDDYKIRYIMLSDDNKAEQANLPSYYECSWMGMACAYRDYLDASSESYNRLTAEETGTSIPLYIETFGCLDSVEKVMSMPVTVSVPLTTFEDVATMYDYLAGEGVTDVNFKLTGYANGGLYSDVPYKLKWESSVGGSSGFEDLTAYAAEKGFGLYPDFDFVFTTQSDGGSKVNMKKNAARTIDNRYTSRRMYSATKQAMVSYYQMILSPDTYSKFYEKLGKKYAKYENATGVSLASFGNALNSDYDENKTVLREEAKEYVLEALAYFKQDYSVMLDGANAYTWSYADHILNVPLDSSRYNFELNSIPFMGVVLHGYVEFAGSAFNKEGNLSYAMLKAMENGASIYFVLSYANTELLKEDVLLSQNYSVRYDIWQNRLVEIYKELDAVLGDVQTKLIIDHQFLDGSRVPDEDELLEDIAEAAKEKAEEIESKLDAEHKETVAALQNARLTATQAADKITALTDYKALLNSERWSQASASTQYVAIYLNDLLKEYDDGEGTVTDATKTSFIKNLQTYVVKRYQNAQKDLNTAAEYLIAARDAYQYLVDHNADAVLQNAAAAGLESAKEAYLAKLSAFEGVTATLSGSALANATDAKSLIDATQYVGEPTAVAQDDLYLFILGKADHDGIEDVNGRYTDEEGQLTIGLKALYNAYIDLLKSQGVYDLLGGDAILNITDSTTPTTPTEPTPPTEPTDPNAPVDENVVVPDPPKSKYAIDNNIVLVTYGEYGQAYKSLILNFNDYAVQTTYNGVTYTIEEYGYVVVYH